MQNCYRDSARENGKLEADPEVLRARVCRQRTALYVMPHGPSKGRLHQTSSCIATHEPQICQLPPALQQELVTGIRKNYFR